MLTRFLSFLQAAIKSGEANLYDQFQIGCGQAEAYRKSVGHCLRRTQWDDVTVEVFMLKKFTIKIEGLK